MDHWLSYVHHIRDGRHLYATDLPAGHFHAVIGSAVRRYTNSCCGSLLLVWHSISIMISIDFEPNAVSFHFMSDSSACRSRACLNFVVSQYFNLLQC